MKRLNKSDGAGVGLMLSSAVLLNCRTDWKNDVGEHHPPLPLTHTHASRLSKHLLVWLQVGGDGI